MSVGALVSSLWKYCPVTESSDMAALPERETEVKGGGRVIMACRSLEKCKAATASLNTKLRALHSPTGGRLDIYIYIGA